VEEEKKEILKEYSLAFGNYINNTYTNKNKLLDTRYKIKNGKKIYASYSKIDGSIFAHIIKNKIEQILKNTNYHVSINNSYIKGCFTEWDLLISKGKEESKKPKYNIYNPEDIICAIELKAGGLAGYNNGQEVEEFFNNIDKSLKQCSNKIKFLYISLNDSETKIDLIKKELKDKYNNKFYNYFVTTGTWHYKIWNKDNLYPAKIDNTTKSLKEIIEEIIEKEIII